MDMFVSISGKQFICHFRKVEEFSVYLFPFWERKRRISHSYAMILKEKTCQNEGFPTHETIYIIIDTFDF